MKTRFYLQENKPRVIATNTHYFYIGILVALWYKNRGIEEWKLPPKQHSLLPPPRSITVVFPNHKYFLLNAPDCISAHIQKIRTPPPPSRILLAFGQVFGQCFQN